MKVLVIVSLFLFSISITHAQSNEQLSKLKYNEAEELYSQKQYGDAYKMLYEVYLLLDKQSNPKIEFLFISILDETLIEDSLDPENCLLLADILRAFIGDYLKRSGLNEDKLKYVYKLSTTIDERINGYKRKINEGERLKSELVQYFNNYDSKIVSRDINKVYDLMGGIELNTNLNDILENRMKQNKNQVIINPTSFDYCYKEISFNRKNVRSVSLDNSAKMFKVNGEYKWKGPGITLMWRQLYIDESDKIIGLMIQTRGADIEKFYVEKLTEQFDARPDQRIQFSHARQYYWFFKSYSVEMKYQLPESVFGSAIFLYVYFHDPAFSKFTKDVITKNINGKDVNVKASDLKIDIR